MGGILGGDDVGRGFLRIHVMVGTAALREGVAAVVEHLAGEGKGELHGLSPKVKEHGVGAPAADKLDGGDVDVCAEHGGGPARAEATGLNPPGVDTRVGLSFGRGEAQGLRHAGGSDLFSFGA